MVQSRVTTSRRASVFALLLSATALLLASLGQRAADANHLTVTAVRGSAFNCSGRVALFGNQQPETQPTASVQLPPGGSATPIRASAPCTVRIPNGPIILSAASVDVTTQGTTGPTGSVTSTATANDVGTDPNEALQATSITSTCSASEAGVTGSTTVIGGTVVTDQTTDPDTTRAVPENPAPNFAIEGVNGAGATYRYVFNEQIVNADGSLTVNAVHLYLLTGPATGDVILGQVTCGVTTTALPPPPPPTTTTTVPATTTTTVPATTTTTVPATTTTTVPATTTTTVAGACVPGEDGAKPGYGKGDKNHRHCGPPGQTGIRPVASSRDGGPSWPLLAGLGVLLLISLVVPFGRRSRGDHRR